MSETNKTVSTKDLKQVLGFWDLMSTAIGQIIGAGIMSLTGVAIAMTGRSVPLAFMVAVVLVLIQSIPTVLINSTARLRGGQYTIINELVSKKLGGFFIVIFILTNMSIAMYALSFADYFIALYAGIPRNIVALATLTFFYAVNCMGVDIMAKLQNVVVVALIAALAVFAFYGMGRVDFANYVQPETWMPGGITGLLSAASLLTFATGGATVVANVAAEAKNPTRDIPLVTIISTLFVAVIYALMSIVAAGVLPVEQVAGMNLTVVAQEILPGPLYLFFIVGGAMFALISTLNAQLGWATKPIMQACVDGWLPPAFAKLTEKGKVPIILLTIFYVLGVVTIVTGLDIGAIGNIVVLVGQATNVMLAYGMLNLSKRFPRQWANSKFNVGQGLLKVFFVLQLLSTALQAYLLGKDLGSNLLMLNVAALVVGLIYSFIWYNSGKVNPEDQVDEN